MLIEKKNSKIFKSVFLCLVFLLFVIFATNTGDMSTIVHITIPPMFFGSIIIIFEDEIKRHIYLKQKPISELAGTFGLPIPMMRSGDFNFSFSGLKTACLYKTQELRQKYKKDTDWSYNFAREFINAISRSLSHKLIKAIEKYPEVKSVFVGGGVSNNKYITREIGNIVRKLKKRLQNTYFLYGGRNLLNIEIILNINWFSVF